tara:strand:+ start:447 stop:629 length:183 start_codon:yes stop_codon:yes gene_type:complete
MDKLEPKLDDKFWLDQGYTFVDGICRNQVWINNQAWLDPAKYKELKPAGYKELKDMGCYK